MSRDCYAALTDVLEQNTTLTALTLRMCDGSDAQVVAFFDAVGRNTTLRSLGDRFCELLAADGVARRGCVNLTTTLARCSPARPQTLCRGRAVR